MSSTFKTPKGTVLHIMDIKGKPYLTVQERIIWFREEHPKGRIITEIISTSETHTIMKASIIVDGEIVAQAHKREDKSHFPDHLEKCETSAIGRALALCGFGTQFTALEFHEGERLADAPSNDSRPRSLGSGEMAIPGGHPLNSLAHSVLAKGDTINAGSNGSLVGLRPSTSPQPQGTVLDAVRALIPVPAPQAAPSWPGDYVVRFGKKYMGLKLSDIGYHDVDGYISWIKTKADAALKNKPEVKEFLKYAALFLDDQSVQEATEDEINREMQIAMNKDISPFDSEEELPF